MQLNETHRMAIDFNNKLRNMLGNRVEDFVILNVVDNPNYREFNIEFKAYDYYMVLFSYDKGRIGCSIECGKHYIPLKNSQQWYSDANFDTFFQELKNELELRIPDKYLEANGWK